MAQSRNVAPFFSLPLELREQIYQEALKSPTQGPDLLRTCWKINTEACKFLYQRPIRFLGQLWLYNWVASAPNAFLPQVTDISLTIQDVDLRPLLDSNVSTSQSPLSDRLLTRDLYAVELRSLKTALSKLPNVNTITIRAIPGRQSHLYRNFLADILEALSLVYPTLLDLNLEGKPYYQSLDFLSRLAKLQSFSFDAISTSSHSETADILGSLEHLSSLSLISHQAILTPSSLRNSEFMGRPQPFTGEAVRTIDQLASLPVTEHAPVPAKKLYFSSDLLSAVQHHKALKSLSISLSHTPNNEMLDSLGRCLRSSNIERLELDWPHLHVQQLRNYSLVTDCCTMLRVRVRSTYDASEMLTYLLERRRLSDRKELREVVLIRANQDYIGVDTAMHDRKDSGCVIDEERSYAVSVSIPSIS
jgi:hypothetical protein